MAAPKIIPIRQVGAGRPAEADDAHSRLERAGFMRKTVIGEPRLSELVENYKAMGYEVEVVPFKTEEPGQEASCNSCFDAETSGCGGNQAYGTVYVRKSAQPRTDDDELF